MDPVAPEQSNGFRETLECKQLSTDTTESAVPAETVSLTEQSAESKRLMTVEPLKLVDSKETAVQNPVVPNRVRLESLGADTALLSKKDLLQERDQPEPIIEDESLKVPIQLVPGEELCRLGHVNSTGDIIMLTTYRIFYTCSQSFVNTALRLVEAVGLASDLATLRTVCKDGTIRCCKFASADNCFKWMTAVSAELGRMPDFPSCFAVTFGVTVRTEKNALWQLECDKPFKLGSELRRLGFDLKTQWRITNINETYGCCKSYPKENVMPREFDDDMLEKAVTFRAQKRFPSAVWRNKENGAVLLRSGQPMVGLFCTRSDEDESLLQAIIKTCGCSERMFIADARSYAVAVANRAKGGGCEYPEYYSNCDVEFMNLPNIHKVRDSFATMRNLVATKLDSASWFSLLESSLWLTYMSTLLDASKCVAQALTTRPVLVHCSDGWDRTPQLVALSQLILDPFYRTFKGFQVLIIKEWLQFGHKFSDRCGHYGSVTDEYSPVFLQWLDAVYQLTLQFPTAFEFNEAYLMKLVHHMYSCMFGTFLCNNEKERESELMYPDTVGIWSLLDGLKPQLSNKLYTPNTHKLLDVSSNLNDLVLWTNVYAPQTSQTGSDTPSEEIGLRRSQSYNEISTSTEANLQQVSRRLSDPDLSSSINLGEDGTMPNVTLAQQTLTASKEFPSGSLTSTSPSFVKLYSEGRSRNNSSASLREFESCRVEAKKKAAKIAPSKKFQYNRYLDIDGMTTHVNTIYEKMEEITSSYEKQIEELQKQIETLREANSHSPNCTGLVIQQGKRNCELRGPSSAGSNCSDQSDGSWESVSTREPSITLWMPDHAVTYCGQCNAPFQVFRRRHHCRHCGQVFCMNCAKAFVPIPDQHLYVPVRVCDRCHTKLAYTEPTSENGELGILDDALEDPTNSNNSANTNDTQTVQSAAFIEPSTTGSRKNLPKSQPIPVNKKNHNGNWIPDLPSSENAPSAPNMSSSPIVAGSYFRTISNKSSSSSGSINCQKTCSQESINVENNVENGTMMMGARV